MSTMTLRSSRSPIGNQHYEKLIPGEWSSQWFFVFCSGALRRGIMVKGFLHVFQLLENLWMELDHFSFKFSRHIQSYVLRSISYSV